MHRNGKPVRKCHGCGLNLKDHCGLFENPREQWQRHNGCPGYGNEEMLLKHQAMQAKMLRDQANKDKRKEGVREQCPEHYNGDRHVALTR